MTAVGMLLRPGFRRRWRSWLALALLVGVFGGLVTATAAGARRTDGAFPRLLAWSNAPDAETYWVTGAGALLGRVQAARLARLPQVRATASTAGWTVLSPAAAELDAAESSTAPMRVKLLTGRLPDPRRADQVDISFTLAEAAHLAVGDTLRLVLLSGASTGVPFRFRIVGVDASPYDFPTGPGTGTNIVTASPAFFRAHRSGLQAFADVSLWLRHGGADVPAVQHEVARLAHGKVSYVNADSTQWARSEHSIHLQAVALWLLCALLAVIGVLLLGQLLARLSFLESADHPSLRALGASRRQLFAVGLGRAAAIGTAGGLAAVAIALGLSPLFPVGLARIAEPHPGFAADWPALALGLGGTVLVTLACAAWPAWRAAASAAARAPGAGGTMPPRARPGPLTRLAAARPVPAGMGVRLALQRGAGRTALPVTSTIAAAVVGVTALSGALVFSASLAHLLATPPLYGVRWDASVQNVESAFNGVQSALASVEHDPQVKVWATADMGAPVEVGGVEQDALAASPGPGGSLRPVLLAGRLPAGPGEVALGARTLATAGSHLGGSVSLSLAGGRPAPFSVVGVAVFPAVTNALGLGHGVAMTPGGLRRLLPPGLHLPPAGTLLVRFRPGVSQQARIAALTARLDQLGPYAVLGPATPTDLVDFGRVQDFPLLLGGSLGVLALLTIGHLLSTSVRRRGRDLAILATIGFTRRQVRATVAWQAATLTVVALLIGIPAGIICGRLAWLVFTRQLGIVPVVDVPLPTLTALAVAATVLALAAAVPLGEAAARSRPARVLRSE
jgi:FtsX-like permease family